MAVRLIIELTNRCNLRCRHCYDERHTGTGDLPLELIQKVLREGRSCGIKELAFTGGEATIHPQFHEIVRLVAEAEYDFGFVSNGVNFANIYRPLLKHRRWLKGTTFSLDGAREETHDRLRGKGSYRRVMQAVSVCAFKEIPFTLNMVLTAHNRREIAEMVELGARLGSKAVRFGHLMFTPETAVRGLDLSPRERLEAEAEIRSLKEPAPILVTMGPGYFSDSPFFPCAPLELEELNLDYKGNVTLCCQLSGYSGVNTEADFLGNLSEVSLAEAIDRSQRMIAAYLEEKQARVARGEFGRLDHFPCWYCVKYLGKVSWLENFPNHPWAREEDFLPGRSHVHA
jgi:MoaA/NifB/PqqE/SkfB family radical SAM enzyme